MEEPIKLFDRLVLLRKATWWEMELPSGSVIFGDAKAEMLGYPASKFKKYQDFTDLVHKDDYPKIMSDMKLHLEGKRDFYETNYRIKNSDGEYISFYDCGKILKEDGENIKLMGFVMLDDDSTKEFKDSFHESVLKGNNSLIEMVKNIQ